MRAIEVVEPLPFCQFFVQIHIISVRQQLIEFLLVRAVGSLDLAVELRRPRLDIDMSDPLVLNVPVELSLEFVTPVGSERVQRQPKWQRLRA